MKNILIILLLFLASCVAPKKCCAQYDVAEYIKNYDLQATLKKHLKLTCLWSELRLSLNMSSSIQALLLIYKEELRVIFQVLKLA